MRTFVVVGHKATVSPNFSLEDIPGTSGRLDILCRCVNAAFILGDHRGMTSDEEAMLEQAGALAVSVGSTSLHADHCIVIINWMLDTDRTPSPVYRNVF